MQLMLLRHGHAEPESTGGDVCRHLTQAGRQDVRNVARQAVMASFLPALALYSSAVRTRETAELFLANLPAPAEWVALPQLYLCDWQTLWNEAAAHLERFDHLLLVGHNPGLSELASRLSPPGSRPAGLHTAELAIFTAPNHLPPTATSFAPLARLRP